VAHLLSNLGTVYAELRLQLDSFRRDISEANQQFANLRQGIQNSPLTEMGRTLTSIGSSMTKYVTLPVVALGTAAVYTGAQFDQAMSVVKAVSSATGDEFQKLRDQAIELGGTTVFSAKDAADGMGILAQAGFQVNEVMEAMPALLDLASAGQLDLSQAGLVLATTMNTFGESADQTARYADIFAQAAASTSTDVKQLAEAMSYGAPSAAAMGYSLEDTAAIMALFSNAGIQSSRAGTTFEAMMRDLAKTAMNAGGALRYTSLGGKEVAIAWYDAQGNTRRFVDILADLEKSLQGASRQEREYALKQLTRTQGMRGLNILLKQGSAELNAMTESMYNSGGAGKSMAETLRDNLSGALEEMKSAIETAMIKISDILTPIVKKITFALTSMINAFSALPSGVHKFLLVLAGLAAVVGPLLLLFGAFLTALPLMEAGFAILATAVGAISWPVVGVVAAIVGLIAVFTLLYTKNETFRRSVQEVWNACRSVVVTTVNVVKTIVLSVWGAISLAWKTHGDKIKKITNEVFTIVKTVLITALKVIEGVVMTLGGLLTGNTEMMAKGVKQIWTSLWTGLGTIVQSAGRLLITIVVSLIDSIVGVFMAFVRNAPQIGKNIVTGIANGIASAGSWLIGKVVELANGIKTAFARVLGIRSPSTVMEGYGEDIGEGLANGIENSKGASLDAMQETADALRNKMEDNVDKINRIGDALTTALKKQYDDLEQAQLDSIDERIRNEQTASDKVIAIYDKEYMERLKLIDEDAYNRTKSLQAQIDAIDELTEAEERDLEVQEHLERVQALRDKISRADSAEDAMRYQQDLTEENERFNRQQLLQSRRDEQKKLRTQIEDLREATEEKKELLKNEYDDKKKTEEERAKLVIEGMTDEKEGIRKLFDAMTTDEALFAEARKLLMEGNQEEILALLQKYNPNWQNAGQTMADSLTNGLNSERQAMQDAIRDAIDCSQIVDDQIVELDRLEERIKAMQKVSSGGGAGGGLGEVEDIMDEGFWDTVMEKLDGKNEKKVPKAKTKKAGQVNTGFSLAGLTPNIDALSTMLEGPSKQFADFAKTARTSIDNIAMWLSGLPARLSTALGTLKTTVGTAFSTIGTTLRNLPTQVGPSVTAFFSDLPYNIGFALGQVITNVGTWAGELKTNMLTAATESLDSVCTTLSNLPGAVQTFLSETMQNVVTWAGELVSTMGTTASDTVESAMTFFATLPGRIKTTLTTAIATIKSHATAFAVAAYYVAYNAVTGFMNFMTTLPSKILGVLRTAIQTMIDIGSEFWSKGYDIASEIWEGFKAGLGINSPSYISKAMDDILTHTTARVKDMRGQLGTLANMSVRPSIALAGANGIGAITQRQTTIVEHVHSGSVIVQGATDKEQFSSTVDIVKDTLRREVRTK